MFALSLSSCGAEDGSQDLMHAVQSSAPKATSPASHWGMLGTCSTTEL